MAATVEDGNDIKQVRHWKSRRYVPIVLNESQYPRSILYPTDFLPYVEEPVQAVLDEFVKKLEGYLGVMKEVINIADIWEKSPAPEGKGKTLKEFLSKVCAISDLAV